MKIYQAREVWLAGAMQDLRGHFKGAGYEIPAAVRVSCGLPSRGAFNPGKRSVGEAWSSVASRDKHHEIFVSPTIDAPLDVLAVLVHELVHVTVGLKAGHRGQFVECAREVGLNGPWTSTTASAALLDTLKAISKRLGAYPHGSLSKMTNNKKKQSTRLIKVGCPACGYTTRITMQWILLAVPVCPVDECERSGEPFEVVWPDAPGGES